MTGAEEVGGIEGGDRVEADSRDVPRCSILCILFVHPISISHRFGRIRIPLLSVHHLLFLTQVLLLVRRILAISMLFFSSPRSFV